MLPASLQPSQSTHPHRLPRSHPGLPAHRYSAFRQMSRYLLLTLALKANQRNTTSKAPPSAAGIKRLSSEAPVGVSSSTPAGPPSSSPAIAPKATSSQVQCPSLTSKGLIADSGVTGYSDQHCTRSGCTKNSLVRFNRPQDRGVTGMLPFLEINVVSVLTRSLEGPSQQDHIHAF